MSDGSKDDKGYEVGYGKPPVHTRFQPGHKGGNRKGRPKGSTNLKTDIQAEFAQLVTLTENGKKIRVTKQRAVIKTLLHNGIKGNDRAGGKALELKLKVVGDEDAEGAVAPLSTNDRAILEAYLKRKGGDHDSE